MSKVKYIGVFGKRNAGKSSLINVITGQDIAIVSDIPGTTTDPVKKRMEIFGIGPVVIVDTAGIDDSGKLGVQRVSKTKEVVAQIDIALLIFTNNTIDGYELELLTLFKSEGIPTILIHNQSDIIPLDPDLALEITQKMGIDVIEFSCNEFDESRLKDSITLLVSLMIKSLVDSPYAPKTVFDGIIDKGDYVLLVCPIDSEAPEGRLILPQVNAIRDILDKGAIATVVQPENLASMAGADGFKKYKLVVTDSQAFDQVSEIIPIDINLTGFSILLARSKGYFDYYLQGTRAIENLKEGSKILILESCTHHTSCDDIGRVKIPKLLKMETGISIFEFTFVSGLDPLPKNLNEFSLAIQCGGCMVTNRQLSSRIKRLISEKIPVSNYGMTLAYCMGIFERSVSLFK